MGAESEAARKRYLPAARYLPSLRLRLSRAFLSIGFHSDLGCQEIRQSFRQLCRGKQEAGRREAGQRRAAPPARQPPMSTRPKGTRVRPGRPPGESFLTDTGESPGPRFGQGKHCSGHGPPDVMRTTVSYPPHTHWARWGLAGPPGPTAIPGAAPSAHSPVAAEFAFNHWESPRRGPYPATPVARPWLRRLGTRLPPLSLQTVGSLFLLTKRPAIKGVPQAWPVGGEGGLAPGPKQHELLAEKADGPGPAPSSAKGSTLSPSRQAPQTQPRGPPYATLPPGHPASLCA